TDSGRHALTKIAGEVTFSLDVRSVDPDRLAELEERVETIAAEVAARRGVAFALGPRTRADVGRVDPAILADLIDGAKQLGIPTRRIVSGASHDAAAFAQAGIPMGMIFVRNANGSHNPDEAGFDIAGIADSQSLYRDVYVCETLVAANTKRIRFGSRVINPMTRHPAVAACAAASVEELAPGRTMIGIGTGDSSVDNIGV